MKKGNGHKPLTLEQLAVISTEVDLIVLLLDEANESEKMTLLARLDLLEKVVESSLKRIQRARLRIIKPDRRGE